MSKRKVEHGRVNDEESILKTAWPDYLLGLVTLGSLGLAVASLFPGTGLQSYALWIDALFLVLLTAGTALSLARQLPWQNVLTVIAVIAVIGGGIHALGVTFSIPFGPFLFNDNAGPRIAGILPWCIPFLWVAMVLTARGVARLMLRPWRKARIYGFRLIGMTIALTMLLDMAFDPFAASTLDLWIWTKTKLPLTWHGAPIISFISWGAVTLFLLAFTTPALIRKQPGQKSGPDYHPLIVWEGLIVWFGIGAGMAGLWTALGLDVILGVAVLFFAIRGARW
jgi:uncharacterized membrane protein